MKETAIPFLIAQATFLLNAFVYAQTFSLWLGAAWILAMVGFCVIYVLLNGAVTRTRYPRRVRT